MKKLRIGFLSIFALLVCLCILPQKAEAASTSDLTFTLNSDGVSYKVTDCKESASGNLEIPATYEGKPVTRIDSWAFEDCSSLQSITIPDGVTNIGQGTFAFCWDLTSVTIPNTVTGIGETAFYECISLTSITIPNGITSIGDLAFSGCNSLTNITIPDGVESIGSDAFCGCSSLTSITIGDSVTSIGNGAFGGCTSLTSINIPDSVISLGEEAFAVCTALETVTIGDGVTGIDYATFSGCTSLTSVTIGSSVASINYEAFKGCTSLTTINIPDSVAYIGENAFDGCNRLKYNSFDDGMYLGNDSNPYHALVDAHVGKGNSTFEVHPDTKVVVYLDFGDPLGMNFNYYGYGYYLGNEENPYLVLYSASGASTCEIHPDTKIIYREAFWDCSNLKSITIPDSVTSIGDYAFSRCDSLTDVTLGKGVTSIGSSAFWSCDSLTTVSIPSSVVTIGDSAFYNYSNTTNLIYCGTPAQWKNVHKSSMSGSGIGDYTLQYHKYENNVCIYCDLVMPFEYTVTDGKATITGCDTAISGDVTIPDTLGGYPVTAIGPEAFRDCTSLTSITIPDSVTSIGDMAFCRCSSLTSVTIGDSVTSIGDFAFDDCHSLTSITIPEGVTSIGEYAFWCCTSLTSITIPDSVTSIGSGAFENCSSLTSVTIGDSVTSIGDSAFYGCSSLTSVTIGDSVTSIGEYAFWGCTSLTSITIPDSVTSIGESAFRNCTKLTNVTIGDGVTYIGNFTFANCTSLAIITIPDGVTGIGGTAFTGCTSLTSITIPDSLTNIFESAFEKCTGLKTVFYKGTALQKENIIISDENNDSITDAIWHYQVEETTFANQACYFCSKCNNYYLSNGDVVKATVVFKNWDGTVISKKLCGYGETITSPTEPSKPADNTYTYTFVGWDKELICTGDMTITATYRPVYIDYTIEFKNWDGAVLSSKTYHYGDAVTVPTIPTKAADNTYTYTFAGWNKAVINCAGNATYTATYTSKYIDYTVRFIDVGGEVLSTETYHWGDTVIAPADPTKAANNIYTYTFAGWDKELVCSGDMAINAIYSSKYIDYTVIFADEDGTEFSKKTYHWGDAIEIPSDPTKAADNTYTYTFAGWDKEVVNCAGNVTYTATYTPKYIDYTVIFVDEDGTELSKKTYHWGDAIESPVVPTKAADNTYTYTFAGWDKEVVNCAGNTTYTATYTPTYINYTVEFKNWDGTIHSSMTYHWGDIIEIPVAPVRERDDYYMYTFAGWGKEIGFCCGNAEYKATFVATHYHTYSAECDPTCNLCGATNYDAIPHDYKAATCTAPKTCKVCGAIEGEALGHTYTNACDTSCNRCGAKRSIKHKYTNDCDTSCNVCKAKRTAPHKYSNSCDTSCNLCKAKRTIKHTYSNGCDTTCNVCKAKRTISHTYKTVTTKATLTKNGKVEKKCTECGKVSSSTTVKYAKTIKLSATSYTYDGKVKTPTVTVKDSAGKTLKKNTDYTVSYSSGRKNVGTYKVTITFKGKYSGTKVLTFKINPKAASIKKLTAKSKGLTVSLNRQTVQSTGYEIQYATSKTFKSAKTTTASYSTSTKSISGLKAKTTYYVRVRTYKTVSGVKYYSGWSTAKYMKTK